MFKRAAFYFSLAFLVPLLATSCGLSATPSDSSDQGKQAILDDVNIYLDTGNCSSALIEVLPLYNSANSDNNVRYSIASVYGCFAGVNFFQFVLNLATAGVTSSPSVLWEFLAKQYPSTDPVINPADKKVESAGFGMDALMAMVSPGQVLIPADLFNVGTNNPGSLLDTDRTGDANLYLLFLAMASVGASENRAGANANGTPTNTGTPLPWVTSSTSGMSTEGCEYASAMVNLADALSTAPTTGQLGTTLTSLDNFIENASYAGSKVGVPLQQLIYDACNYGCQNQVPLGPSSPGATGESAALNSEGNWSATACGSDTGVCPGCPLLLRDRNNCAGTTNDQVSCAAAGVINMMNQSAFGWH
jgi:hypothetical protein